MQLMQSALVSPEVPSCGRSLAESVLSKGPEPLAKSGRDLLVCTRRQCVSKHVLPGGPDMYSPRVAFVCGPALATSTNAAGQLQAKQSTSSC